jgi:VanZ family protein
MKRTDFLRWYLPLYLWAATILILTSLPTLETPDIGLSFQDKLAHFVVYYILAFLLTRAMTKRSAINRRTMVLSTLFALLFAAFDELHQLVIPGRSGEFLDFIADSFGIFCAQISFVLLEEKKHSWEIEETDAD